MSTENPGHLAVATRRRATDVRTRARAALRRLDRDGGPITFITVADAAQVSRSMLYRDPTLRAEIERLRTAQHPSSPRPPAAQRASDASLRQRLDAALDDVRSLRGQNHQLREKVAQLLGEQRTGGIRQRTTAGSAGPCN